jgi:hypothetical protein
MTEQELIQAIFKKSNEFAIMTGLHTANVAYVPDKYKNICMSGSWKIINGKLILLNSITVFFKPFELIFVNYMENPSDQMCNIPIADEKTKERTFLKIGNIRIDVADIVAYYKQGNEDLYIDLRYTKNSKWIHESPAIIRQAIVDLDNYFNPQVIL